MNNIPTLGWSDFALQRYVPDSGHTYFTGSEADLLELVRHTWSQRRPGDGRTNLEQVVVVPVDPDRFVGSVVLVDEKTQLTAHSVRRQPQEQPYIEVSAHGPCEPVRHAAVVLYSASTLLENDGTRSTDAEWEVVCLIASSVAPEPMDPLTMARNMLAMPGGTPCEYTARQFADSIWYWAGRAKVDPAT
jgi:hypothetical protein